MTTVDQVFVLGNSRSGTTMLAKMLGRHSEIFTFRELHFFEELWLPARQGSTPLCPEEARALADRLLHNQRDSYHAPYRPGTYMADAEAVVNGLALRPTPPDVFSAVLASETRRHGKSVACEQTPRNAYYIEEITGLHPAPYVIAIVRDPRDVLLSQKNWWKRGFRGTSTLPIKVTIRRWADYHPVTTSLLWRGGVRAVDRFLGREHVRVTRFEDLIASPQHELERLLEPLDLVFEPRMLEVPQISSSTLSDRIDQSGVDASVVGLWRHGLTRTEVWLSQLINRAEYERYGYFPEPVHPQPLALAALLLGWPVKLILAFLLNEGRTKSVIDSFRRRFCM